MEMEMARGISSLLLASPASKPKHHAKEDASEVAHLKGETPNAHHLLAKQLGNSRKRVAGQGSTVRKGSSESNEPKSNVTLLFFVNYCFH
jgi:hypothetical protein